MKKDLCALSVDPLRLCALGSVVHRVALLPVLAFFCLTSASTGAIHFVNLGATGLNDGTSWLIAFTPLNDVLTVAVSADEVLISERIPTRIRPPSLDHFPSSFE